MGQHDWRVLIEADAPGAAERLAEHLRTLLYVPGATRVILGHDGCAYADAATKERAQQAGEALSAAGGPIQAHATISRQDTPQAALAGETVFELAPWWRRVVAQTIDTIPVFLIGLVLLAIAGQHPFWWSFARDHHLNGDQLTIRYGLSLVAVALYYPLIMWRTNGQTLGKFALSIRAVRTDAQAMSVPRAGWREVIVKSAVLDLILAVPVAGEAISFVGWLLDSLWPLWDPQNRALHDMLAATRVVRAGSSSAPAATGSRDA
jgi:uncharacterized RDD family membrane protein YckC